MAALVECVPNFSEGRDPATIAALQGSLPNVAQLLIVFDPNPALLNEVEAGSLGGGNVVPADLPFALTIVPKDSAGNTVVPPPTPGVAPADALAQALAQVPVQLSLPVLPMRTPAPARPGSANLSPAVSPVALRDGVFAWLQAVYDVSGFRGYRRPPATFVAPGSAVTLPGAFGSADPLSLTAGQATQADLPVAGASTATSLVNTLGTSVLRVPISELRGTLFLPTTLIPAYVANFDENVHIFSGPFAEAIDYGIAGPQFTTFTVVAPQLAGRLFVYDPATDNYGWIDVAGVGPVAAPSPPTQE